MSLRNWTENPAFSGIKNNVFRETANNVNFLRLSDAGTPDSSVVESGTYDFGPIDLGKKFHCRVAPMIDVIRMGLGDIDLFDNRQGLFDAQIGNFDGAQSVLEEIDVQFLISVTNDDPNGSPIWGPWEQLDISNFQFRAAQFRLVMTTKNPFATPKVTAVSVTLDMDDRIEAGDDISFTGSITITYSKEFQAPPSVGVTIQDLQNLTRSRIYDKTATGFSVEILDNNGVQSSGQVSMDWLAKGYGEA